MEQLWADPTRLHNLSNFLQWFGIALIFLGGILQVGRLVVDRREKLLTGQIQAERDRALRDSTEKLRPIRQPISSGSAVVALLTTTNDANLFKLPGDEPQQITSIGAPDVFLSFLVGDEIVLEFTGMETLAQKRERGGALIQGIVTLAPNAPGVGSYINALKKATRAVIRIRPMQANHEIQDGKADITINNVLKFRLVVPPQSTTTRSAIIEDLSPMHKGIDANQ
jgi:hypothetical protein